MWKATILRTLHHLVVPDWWALRSFPKSTRLRIERAIAASESAHLGELRFVVEASQFSQLGVWDTEHNSGVLIYVQLVDRRVEIVADRGINARVEEGFWNAICRRIEAAYRAGSFEQGTLLALNDVTAVLAEHFPATGDNPDELPNAPVIR